MPLSMGGHISTTATSIYYLRFMYLSGCDFMGPRGSNELAKQKEEKAGKEGVFLDVLINHTRIRQKVFQTNGNHPQMSNEAKKCQFDG